MTAERRFLPLLLLTFLIGLAGCDEEETVEFNCETYAVMYDANSADSGSVPTDEGAYESGDEATILGNRGGLERLGYDLAGWTTEPDGNGALYTEGNTITVTWPGVTLYARWYKIYETEYALSDLGPAGGKIFYINPDYRTDGWRYLEAAPADLSPGRWIEGGSTQSMMNGNTSPLIGAGPANTEAIIAQEGHTNSLAKRCADHTVANGDVTYDDWFLPSIDELNQLYLAHTGGMADQNYPSSTENTAVRFWSVYFNDLVLGAHFSQEKTNPNFSARPIRRF